MLLGGPGDVVCEELDCSALSAAKDLRLGCVRQSVNATYAVHLRNTAGEYARTTDRMDEMLLTRCSLARILTLRPRASGRLHANEGDTSGHPVRWNGLQQARESPQYTRPSLYTVRSAPWCLRERLSRSASTRSFRAMVPRQ